MRTLLRSRASLSVAERTTPLDPVSKAVLATTPRTVATGRPSGGDGKGVGERGGGGAEGGLRLPLRSSSKGGKPGGGAHVDFLSAMIADRRSRSG